PELSDITLHDHSAGNNATRAKKWRLLGRKASVVGAVCIGLVMILLAAMVWYGQQLKPVDTASEEKIKISVQSGEGLSQIARTLRQKGLIRSELAFEWYVRQSGKTSLLQVGTYRLGKSEGVPEIVKHLTSGNTDSFSITFLPGATLAQHRKVLIATGYDETQVDAALAKTYSGPLFESKPASADLEGYIYGETYNFAADATPEQILQYVFDYYAEVVKKNDLTNLYKKQGFSLYQGITMASIIQREVATASDAAQVAQVFKKRYDMGMQLGSDVTYQYIADKTGQARSVDLDSPYNTRRYTGLPPGPISSPGLDALRAVANPAPGDYVYFLSGDDDKTYFARTNEEHEKNIRDHCQKKCQII
ncbi:MAG: endolytic transglycosylase MltG, partial [Candidatus Saccharimonadales bacterium]